MTLKKTEYPKHKTKTQNFQAYRYSVRDNIKYKLYVFEGAKFQYKQRCIEKTWAEMVRAKLVSGPS